MDRSVVPVLVYRPISRRAFARQMALLRHAGYETITLDQLVNFAAGENATLPPRPLLLTFDEGRRELRSDVDPVLREAGFNAVLFVDTGAVEADSPEHLTWSELNGMQRSVRWEVQLESGTGNHRIRYGPRPGDVGPFYAYRGREEILGGWRERVFSDITHGERQLAFRIRGYRPLAFAPPYGNYGQAGTNDSRIPRELLARLLLSFKLVFTQDRSGFARRGAIDEQPFGRIEVTRDTSEQELHSLLTGSR